MQPDLPSLEALLADIARRVRPAVPDMPQDEFDRLVRRMAELELRYRDRPAETNWRQLTPPLGVEAQERSP